MVKSEQKPVRVRFAPSPTGPLHIGGVRTALFNWLFARQNGGVFILRIEDTDKARSEKKYEAQIFEGLKLLGLTWDEGPSESKDKGKYGPYRQSERIAIYKKYLEQLLEEKKAYYCYCTKEYLEAERQAMLGQGLSPKYSGHCRNLKEPPAGKKTQVIRFATPETTVEFKDVIRGKVSFDAGLFGDIAIAKDQESPLYNFAVVVDDALMEVSHVIRGEEHLSNTPRQILFQRALGFEVPEYAHLPLILNPDRSKMSKRFTDTALAEYKTKGYSPEVIVNFLALLGWHPQHDKEIFTLDELVKEFDLKRVQKGGAVFNQEKLDWLQKEHLKNLSTDEMVNRLEPIFKEKGIPVEKIFLTKVLELERPRLKTLNEFPDVAGFFFKLQDYDAHLLVWDKEPVAKTKSILEAVSARIETLNAGDFENGKLSAAFEDLVLKEGRGSVYWPLRVALSGLRASPDPMEIARILGKKEILARVRTAIIKIDALQ